MNKEIEELKKLLKLAGKLAISSRNVVTSTVRNLSSNLEIMERDLNKYDNAIIEATTNTTRKEK